MKVLEHGSIYYKKHGIVRCKCGCKYEHSEEDVKSAPRPFYDYKLGWFYRLLKYVECPECGDKYWFDEMTPISEEEYNWRMRESEIEIGE